LATTNRAKQAWQLQTEPGKIGDYKNNMPIDIVILILLTLAALFELSVCAGLISVVFISVTTMTQPQSRQEVAQHTRDRLGRFKFLPLIIMLVALALVILNLKPGAPLSVPEAGEDVRSILWNQRPLDLIGQVLILLAGVFGVVILFKEKSKDE